MSGHQWQDPEDLPLAMLCDYDYDGLKTVAPVTIEIVNSIGTILTVRYHAAGDYEDRWVDSFGYFHEPVKWRHLPR